MLSFSLAKAIDCLLTLVCIFVITFFALRLLPGGPFDEETALSAAAQARLSEEYGLDKPLPQQFIIYCRNFFAGNLGESTRLNGKNVSEILAETLPLSVMLGGLALLLALLIGVSLGLASAQWNANFFGKLILPLGVLASSIPTLVMAVLIIHLLGPHIDLSPQSSPESPWLGLNKILWPAFILALRPAGLFLRLVRSSALKTLGQKYIRTARAAGVTPLRLLVCHVLPNALIAHLPILAPIAADLLTGAFIVESLFSLPGLGLHFVNALVSRDYRVLMMVVMIFALVLLVLAWTAEVITRRFDPRVEASQ